MDYHSGGHGHAVMLGKKCQFQYHQYNQDPTDTTQWNVFLLFLYNSHCKLDENTQKCSIFKTNVFLLRLISKDTHTQYDTETSQRPTGCTVAIEPDRHRIGPEVSHSVIPAKGPNSRGVRGLGPPTFWLAHLIKLFYFNTHLNTQLRPNICSL